MQDPEQAAHIELLDAVLARLEGDDRGELESWQYPDKALLRELADTQRRLSRLQARWLALLAEAEKREATVKLTGLPTSSWLADRNTHWARGAREEVRLAVRLSQQSLVSQAMAAGELSLEQARVISTGLDRLPVGLDSSQRDAVEQHLVQLGGEFGPYGLSRLVNRAVEVVAPETAEECDRKAVERMEAEQAHTRYLSWCYDDEGALLLRGKLAKVPAQRLVGLLQALAAGARRNAALAGIELERSQANADALVLLAEHYTGCQEPPRHSADRPRVLVTIDHDVLVGRLGTATLLNTGEVISAQEARLLACDAGILPVVMRGHSVPVDVGREQRLFTGTLRDLLVARDQGCAFPGCDRHPADCDAHHIRPWHQGGTTALANGVLLCPWHHHLAEPDPNQPAHTQWAIRLDAGGNPEIGAPEGLGAPPGQRRWRQHHRYRT